MYSNLQTRWSFLTPNKQRNITWTDFTSIYFYKFLMVNYVNANLNYCADIS